MSFLRAKGHFFSHPAVGIHFINASKVIGNIETLSITEGFGNRAEVGYTRSFHQFGNSGPGTRDGQCGVGIHSVGQRSAGHRRISASFGTPAA